MSRGAEVLNRVTHNVASLCYIIIPLLLLSWVQFILAAEIVNLSPSKGGKLPSIRLPVPKDSEEKNYLGLSGEGLFRIPQIKAEGVLIEVFNTYCPICQTTTSTMGDLYRQIENNSDLKDKIKLIGIGVGNNDLEAKIFKQTYNVPFPIFSDENYEIHKALGEVRTPFFIALKLDGGDHQEIVHTYLGGFTDSTGFLNLMLQAYGIKHEDLLIKQAGSSPVEPPSTMNP
jgi:thiol-disulfide isomerase/thioredoxin